MRYISPISLHYVCIGRLIQALQLNMYHFAPKSKDAGTGGGGAGGQLPLQLKMRRGTAPPT